MRNAMSSAGCLSDRMVRTCAIGITVSLGCRLGQPLRHQRGFGFVSVIPEPSALTVACNWSSICSLSSASARCTANWVSAVASFVCRSLIVSLTASLTALMTLIAAMVSSAATGICHCSPCAPATLYAPATCPAFKRLRHVWLLTPVRLAASDHK